VLLKANVSLGEKKGESKRVKCNKKKEKEKFDKYY
jgi:hypothetical protein